MSQKDFGFPVGGPQPALEGFGEMPIRLKLANQHAPSLTPGASRQQGLVLAKIGIPADRPD